QPIAVSVISTASPLAAAASAAMPPVTTSGRVGCGRALRPSPDPEAPGGPFGSGASGTSAETLTPPILATILARARKARRRGHVYGECRRALARHRAAREGLQGPLAARYYGEHHSGARSAPGFRGSSPRASTAPPG